jgi:hypothetical protein
VVFCLLSFALGVVAAPGGTKKEASKRKVPETPTLQQRILANDREAKERRAEEAYEKRDTKIAPWVEDAVPPNPDNAALLYYQAFLLRPEPDMAMTSKLDKVYRGVESDRQVRAYLGHCLPMIQMVELASRIPQCTWGIWHGPGLRFSTDLLSEVKDLTRVLRLDARTLAADGHYRAALERCLTLRRLARHLSESDDSGIVLFSRVPDAAALHIVRHVLGVMPPDANTLTWFRGQFAVVQGVPLAFAKTLQVDFKDYLNNAITNPAHLRYLRNLLIRNAENEEAKETARNLTDEQFMSHAREPLPHFFDSIFRIDDSEMPYEQKLAQMQKLHKQLKDKYSTDPIVTSVLQRVGLGYMIDRQYPFQVEHEAHINGIKAAVEVYLVLAKTGQLPEKLPSHLPKDPFTGRDFAYEITQEGFALRCQGKDFQGRGKQRLEFTIRK